jgi:hypothetical protein
MLSKSPPLARPGRFDAGNERGWQARRRGPFATAAKWSLTSTNSLSLTRKPMAIPTVYSEYRLEVILAVAKDDQECSLRSAAPPFIWRTWPPPFSQLSGADISPGMIEAARRRVRTSPYRDRIELRVDPIGVLLRRGRSPNRTSLVRPIRRGCTPTRFPASLGLHQSSPRACAHRSRFVILSV